MPFTPTLPETPSVVELREQLLAAGDYLVGLQASAPETRDATWAADVRSAVQFINLADPAVQAYERGHAQPESTGLPDAATLSVRNEEGRSAGELFIVDEGYRDFAGRHVSSATFHEVELRGSLLVDNREVRALLDSGTDSGDAGLLAPVGQPTAVPIRFRQQRFFVRDLLSVQGTGLNLIPYIRELNAVANETGASAVAEGSAKPEVTMEFEADEAPVRKIAAWIPATTEIIDDAPTLRGYIDTRLSYMLALREELQVINGSGTAPQLKGILQFGGVQTQAFSTDEATTLGLAIAKVETVDGEADGIVMHPTRYWTMVTRRSEAQFDGAGMGGAPFDTPRGTVWGLPVVRSRSVGTTKALVGSFRMGATLFDRMETTIRVGNQHSDYFTNNKVAILAEERVALAVHRPDFFVDATVSA